MLSKFVIMLAIASAVAFAIRYFGELEDEVVLKQEVAGQLDDLRERLFRR
jgi:hypothetical protein